MALVGQITTVIGVAGPMGPPGISEDNMVYARRTEFVSENVIFKGEAAVGTATSDAGWRVRRILVDANNNVTETWADGNANFDKRWDDRFSLVYS